MTPLNKSILLAFFAIFLVINNSCKKLVQISEPSNTITSTEVFSNDATANQAVASIYNNMSSTLQFLNGAVTLYTGLSSDELYYFLSDEDISPFQSNTLLSDNSIVNSQIWQPAYYTIYQCNAAISGLNESGTVTRAQKRQLIGEAKFLRALSNFYLTNMFGSIPIVNSTEWANTDSLHRSTPEIVYQQIISDLRSAEDSLQQDYSNAKGEKIRANRSAASALLARVYLYLGDWANAIKESSLVIDNVQYSLDSNLNDVFLKNSGESILQLQTDENIYPYALAEPNTIIPYNPNTDPPTYYITPYLLSAFENGDLRRTNWLDSTNYTDDTGSVTTYFYPFKYKVNYGAQGDVSEYYTILRLAEQYLIRAEAEANQTATLVSAITDLNIIRHRAGLSKLNDNLTQPDVMAAIARERRVELFSELGHRWFDLKRTGQASIMLAPVKQQWSPDAQLYPIPVIELQTNHNLTQNHGY